ncbi:MAG: hypothetical protein JW904_00290 [Spirochaetales bacterium]|nr:hypothetical protein [Spirochaetales bacterium]
MRNMKKSAIVLIFLVYTVSMAMALEPREHEPNADSDTVAAEIPGEESEIEPVYLPEGNIENPMSPGFQGGGYYLLNSGDMYFGGEMVFDIFYGLQRSKRSDRTLERARSEVFISVGFYYGDRPDAEYFFHYLMGFNISFESSANISRNFLVPYMGVSVGGITIKDRGSAFVTIPTMGINIISMKAISLNVEGGLLCSLVGFDEFLAVKASATLVIAL